MLLRKSPDIAAGLRHDPLAGSTCTLSMIIITAEMRQRTLVTVRTHETFVPSVFTANLRGGMVHKMDQLEATLCECDVDIGCIIETWLNKTVPSKLVNIPGYVMPRSDRRHQQDAAIPYDHVR